MLKEPGFLQPRLFLCFRAAANTSSRRFGEKSGSKELYLGVCRYRRPTIKVPPTTFQIVSVGNVSTGRSWVSPAWSLG